MDNFNDGSSRKSEKELQTRYGPLKGHEWLELDNWAFQELPKAAYKLLQKIYRHHKVPIAKWHRQSPRRS